MKKTSWMMLAIAVLCGGLGWCLLSGLLSGVVFEWPLIMMFGLDGIALLLVACGVCFIASVALFITWLLEIGVLAYKEES